MTDHLKTIHHIAEAANITPARPTRRRKLPIRPFKATSAVARAVIYDACVPGTRLTLNKFCRTDYAIERGGVYLYSVSGDVVRELARMGVITLTSESVGGHALTYEPTLAGALLRERITRSP